MRRRIRLLTGLGERKLIALLVFALAGVTAFAYDASVHVEARWRVLPYQSLSLTGSDGDSSVVSVSLPTATASDRESGFAETEGAVRLHVASNVAWKVQLRLADSAGAGIEARQGGADYVTLGAAPIVLAAGTYGVYDVDLDVRRPLDGEEGASGTLVYLIVTIMPE